MCRIRVDNKVQMESLFLSGLEVPQSRQLKDLSSDRWYINLVLCLAVLSLILVGVFENEKGFYIAALLYVLQFLEYFWSSTR